MLSRFPLTLQWQFYASLSMFYQRVSAYIESDFSHWLMTSYAEDCYMKAKHLSSLCLHYRFFEDYFKDATSIALIDAVFEKFPLPGSWCFDDAETYILSLVTGVEL